MTEETKEPISKIKILIRYVLHMLLTFACGAGVAVFSNEVILEDAWNDQYFICAGVLLAVIALCSLLERKKIYCSVRSVGIQLACFLVSALLLLLSDYYVNLPIWLIGGIAAAALVNRNIGMLYLYYFVYHAIYLQGSWLNGLVFHFVAATFIAFLIPKMKSFLGMFYMMAFATCIIVTGSVLHNKMVIDEGMMLDTFYILCTYLACIFITMLLVKWVGKPKNVTVDEPESANDYAYLDLLAQETAEQDAAIAAIKNVSLTDTESGEATETKEAAETKEVTENKAHTEDTEDTENTEPAEPAEHPEPVAAEVLEAAVTVEALEENIQTEEIDYTPYCDEKSELLLELRTKSKSAYAQAVLLGKLASETAKSIGLNVDLVKAAGLYKKIGKIRENSNEYTSTEVAKEHNFPEPLVYLLDQLNHNIIEQKEAALLLITDGVISYYSIVRTHKTDIPVEKIVDNIVSKKIFQGEFNESGLSMQECFLLREKLIDLLKAQDKKRAAR